MGYAIVGYFDNKSDVIVRELWKGMAEIGVDDYLYKSENNPHFKFIIYEQLDLDRVKTILESLAKNQEKIPIQFKSYSFYPNDMPFINIDIAVSTEILNLHQKIRKKVDLYSKTYGVDYFDNGIWKPDCQLTKEIPKEKLETAIKYLADRALPFSGQINRLGIIEFHPAKQIVSYELV